ncbi:LysM peptidoglycan-binding domain-containing protein [Cognatilysobacter bugurensis]|uniref:LysM domain-containing protein n=1 Tax=Cognatilysobacter bugurensis TaxID=543356 RepID=A0A918W949_9GAMM|nr:hypothetical protein GCM10007067_21910 [Lysobacter bugurensis]
MSRTPDDERSNPIKRAFAKFLERGDVSKPKTPAATPQPTQTTAARPAPQVQTARPDSGPTAAPRANGATSTPVTRSAASGTLAGGATQGATHNTTTGTQPPTTGALRQRTYTVQKGDSLSKIAQQVYGRADRWHAIFDANRDQIEDPDMIHPGQVLVLPNAPKLH